MSMYRKIMDSKFMDLVEVIGDAVVETIKFTAEVLHDTFDHPCGSPQPQFGNGYNYKETSNNKGYDEDTYNYFRNLTHSEQQEYFKSNQYLNKYYDERHIYNTVEQQAKQIAEIAYKENKSFTNKYDRY